MPDLSPTILTNEERPPILRATAGKLRGHLIVSSALGTALRGARIARSAHRKAERRGFRGSPEQDWLDAEAELDRWREHEGRVLEAPPYPRPDRLESSRTLGTMGVGTALSRTWRTRDP